MIVDLSKTEDCPAEASTSGPLNLESNEQLGNGQEDHADATDPAALSDYTGASIRVLEGIEAIRLRPAMYIGDTTRMDCIIW